MESGLLTSLRKYRSRENSDPLENFITEAFAWILQNHSEFSEYFLNKVIDNPIMELDGLDKKECEWLTQYNFNGVFPDLVCLSNDVAIIFEHKTWSKLHDGQLKNYRAYAEKHFSSSKVVLITASKYQHAQKPDLALCWSNIYELISEWLDNNPSAPFIFQDFMELLKSEGMGPPAPISHDSIMYYYASLNLKNKIGELIKRVEGKDWELNIETGYKKSVPSKRRLAYGEEWGRIGFNLLDGWKPGIFVGILLDGKDHCTKPINRTKGPDFCLIIDFHQSLHNDYPSNENYQKMVISLSEEVNSLDGWELYNHLNDSNVNRKNKWHPIHIRKPMLDVFIGSVTIEEQEERFYSTANKLIQLVSNNEYFLKLIGEYSQRSEIHPTSEN